MKNKMNVLAIIALFGGLVAAVFAGSWSHVTVGTSSAPPTFFQQDVVVPAPAYVEQQTISYGPGISTTVLVNNGPLGNYSDSAPTNITRSGNVGQVHIAYCT